MPHDQDTIPAGERTITDRTIPTTDDFPDPETATCPNCGKRMIRRSTGIWSSTEPGRECYDYACCCGASYRGGTAGEAEKLHVPGEAFDKAWAEANRDRAPEYVNTGEVQNVAEGPAAVTGPPGPVLIEAATGRTESMEPPDVAEAPTPVFFTQPVEPPAAPLFREPVEAEGSGEIIGTDGMGRPIRADDDLGGLD